ncbi:MAG: tetratricopeptide repeat protein [Desulfobacula sp.]|uniref:tetratricopeptide repeat protein n=1 Tax=Desulfobacula sp. TaxID=2593537 RepID=UPI0025C02ACD|nr:tetratricopeptide repeat protein [Desulfobacula sp.]MCD4722037.1 tetratricopeptide repeat protein [Desulfobacula sp.]
MSVIYKTLKKLKTESAEDAENKGVSKKGNKNYSFKEISSNPAIIIFIALLILITCVGVFFVVRSLNKTDNNQPRPKVFPIHENSEYIEKDESPEGEEKESLNVRYMPAEAKNKSAQDVAGKDAETQDISSQKDVKTSKIATHRTIESQQVDRKQLGFESPLIFQGQYSSPVKVAYSPKISEEKKLKEKVRTQRIHRANLEKSLKISKLVDRIHRSIKAGNIGLTEKFLTELETLKGKDNTYVFKLRAFWYLSRQDYGSATRFLKKVLDKNERDLEAGINMAIVEIKTKEFQKAGERLKRLKEIYPENTAISVLIDKLKLRYR